MKLTALLACSSLMAATSLAAQDFTSTVKSLVAENEAANPLAIKGTAPGWFFLRKELLHLQHGDLANADLAKANVEGTDPLPVIAKYNEELKALGVELLLVPVPAKATIYPEKLSDKIDPKTVPSMAALFAKLKASGVEVLDLEALFKAERTKNPDKQLYCATDSHWSPYAAQLTARLIGAKYKERKEISEHSLADLIVLKPETIEFHGDLLTDAEKSTLPKEKLPIERAGMANQDGSQVTTLESDPKSAMLVIGDSHLQVFRRGGNMLATCGGFVDHLQESMFAAVDEMTNQGSGSHIPRMEVARRSVKEPELWTQKKVVVWLFTAREFTQGMWKMLPAKVKK
jgi:alginate O-acetyltransferase complex protein AlgJ